MSLTGQQQSFTSVRFEEACKMPEMVSLGLDQAFLNTLTPIAQGQPAPQLWEVAFALGISRSALRAHLGDPFYVETDSRCSFGGEEDWWAYRTPADKVVAVCLRVPYEHAVLYVSETSDYSVQESTLLLRPWTVTLRDKPYPY